MASNLPFISMGEQALLPECPPRPTFAQRIQRAHDLAETHTSVSGILSFYTRLLFDQQHVFDCLREPGNTSNILSSSDQWPLAIDLLLPHFPDFARSVAEIAPYPMSARAAELTVTDSAELTRILTSFWADRMSEQEFVSAADRYIAMSFLQPYAELLASLRQSPPSHALSCGVCPICGSEPVCGVLRDRGHGAGRSLVCSLCITEWSFLRVACPACGEDRFESLSVFTREDLPHVRIDACDTCQHYVKTVDMTKNGLAVPVVDELAAVSLDLWATEHRYRKLRINLIGI